MSHTSMSHVAHINESCHTYECVMGLQPKTTWTCMCAYEHISVMYSYVRHCAFMCDIFICERNVEHAHTCTHTRTHTYTHIHIHRHTQVCDAKLLRHAWCVYENAVEHIHIRTQQNTQTHIHTYTHTHTLTHTGLRHKTPHTLTQPNAHTHEHGHTHSFATQNYFDTHGVFMSTLWSTPLLLIGVVMLFQSLYTSSSLLIQVSLYLSLSLFLYLFLCLSLALFLYLSLIMLFQCLYTSSSLLI